jgi:hypothetical protein
MAVRDRSASDETYARTAPAEEIPLWLRSADPAVLLALVDNPALNEQHVEILLRRADLPPAVLAALARHPTLSASYAVRRDIVRHPHAPRLVALRWVRQLYLFDLVRLTLLPSVSAELKRIAEDTLIARLPQIPLGEKLTLARRASGRVASALLAEGVPLAVRPALDNPFLAEGHLLQLLARDELAPHVVAAIAEHPRWSHRPGVRMALVRHPATPPACVRALLPELSLDELRDLVALARLQPERRQWLEQEIAQRAQFGRSR